jgi:hypothetical protein
MFGSRNARRAMTKQSNKLIAAAVLLSSLIGLSALAAPDEGEVRATEHYKQQDRCSTIVQYGEQATPIGPTTGNPEKDTYAFPVQHTGIVCGAAHP